MRARPLISLLTLSLLFLSPTPAPADEGTPPGVEELGGIGGLGVPDADQVATAVAQAVDPASLRPAAPGPRIAILGTGVDTAVLPSSLVPQITLLGSGGDPVGMGTYAASVLLQLVPDARITSIGIYPGGRFNPWWQWGGLQWLIANAAQFDAVLYAMPPMDFLDPISASMATGEWEGMFDAITDHPLPGSRGPIYGLPLRDDLFRYQVQGTPYYNFLALDRFRWVLRFWIVAKYQIKAITDAGLAVVVPAGDVPKPNPQTIFGVGNFPEVITVGAHNGETVSQSSGSGPSIDGRVKPDLVAPSGVVGLLPENALLSRVLGPKGLLDPALQPAWDAGEPVTKARARLDSTVTAAATVAAAVGGLAAQGIRDPRKQRGALIASAEPLPGVPVWRQGAGVLGRIPDATFANSQALVLGNADLGIEPAAGEWSVTVPVAQGTASTGSATTSDHIGIGPDAKNEILTVPASESPTLSISATNDGVRISTPLLGSGFRAGLFCGYLPVPLTPVAVQPGVTVGDGRTELVPSCLVNGFELAVARANLIHNESVEDLTFTLGPALPPGASLLEHALHLLPVDPLGFNVFFSVTSNREPCQDHDPAGVPGTVCEFRYGHAHFRNIPPGYYKVRQFSDYGAPIRETRTKQSCTGTGCTKVVDDDIGANPAYVSFKTLLLPALPSCAPYVGYDEWGDWSGHGMRPPPETTWRGCTEKYLKAKFAPVAPNVDAFVQYDRFTGGYMIGPSALADPKQEPGTGGDPRLRVNLGFLRKRVETNVVSRYIDLLNACQDLRWWTWRPSTWPVTPGALAAALPGDLGIEFGCPNDLTSFVRNVVTGDSSSATLGVGIAQYPFNLTRPNYSAHMSVNLRYRLSNAYLVIVVQMGRDFAYGVVTPKGTFRLPSGGPRTPINLSNLEVWGQSEGKANFEFRMLPRGASQGNLWVVFWPPSNSVLSSGEISDLSFELDTWTNVAWPAMNFDGRPADPLKPCPMGMEAGQPVWTTDDVCGHTFSLSSNYNPKREGMEWGAKRTVGQMDPPPPGEQDYCRPIEDVRVCEDWTVMVHSPKNGGDLITGTTLMDVVDASDRASMPSILAEMAAKGSTLVDPQRGTSDFLFKLTFAETLAELEAKLLLQGSMKTNGRSWEQLGFPEAVLRTHPGALEVCIRDVRSPHADPRKNGNSWCPGHVDASGNWVVDPAPVVSLPRETGRVVVAPYQPFANTAYFIDW